jgi:hypothetical protein
LAINSELLALVKGAKSKYSRSSKFVKLKEGKTCLRILGLPGKKFWADMGVHWIKTELNGKPVAVVGCHDMVHETPCDVCEAIAKASAVVHDDESLALIKEWRAKRSILVNALVRSGPDKSDSPQIVELTSTCFGDVLSIVETYAAEDIDILDLKSGVDLVVERKGSGKDTTYTVMVAPKSFPVPANILEGLHDLEAAIEKEHFKGDERKALAAIANMTGVTVGARLAGPSRTDLLTGPAGVVEDAVIEEAVVEELAKAGARAPSPSITPAKAAKAAPSFSSSATAEVDDIDAMLASLGDLDK